jgi:hypothetical protein
MVATFIIKQSPHTFGALMCLTLSAAGSESECVVTQLEHQASFKPFQGNQQLAIGC